MMSSFVSRSAFVFAVALSLVVISTAVDPVQFKKCHSHANTGRCFQALNDALNESDGVMSTACSSFHGKASSLGLGSVPDSCCDVLCYCRQNQGDRNVCGGAA